MKHLKRMFLPLLLAPLFLGFHTAEETLDGTWIRKDDHLKIEIQKDHAHIVMEGNEKFPCEVSSLYLYKDIRPVKSNHWTCNFLVVTIGSCQTEYQSGEIIISKTGELVVICPGFASKVYAKARPRHES